MWRGRIHQCACALTSTPPPLFFIVFALTHPAPQRQELKLVPDGLVAGAAPNADDDPNAGADVCCGVAPNAGAGLAAAPNAGAVEAAAAPKPPNEG